MIKIIDFLKNVKFPALNEKRKPPSIFQEAFNINQRDQPSFKSGVEILSNNQNTEEDKVKVKKIEKKVVQT